MSESINLSGIVLSAMPVGENDKRLVLLTCEEGKITAFARGARRPRSTLLAASNPFATGVFSVVPGRSAYSLTSAEIKEYFTDLAADMPGVYYGFYFLELANYYGREGIESTEMLNLLYLSLKALLNPRFDDRLVRRIYEIRLMSLNGDYSPERADDSIRYTCRYICTAPLQKLFHFSVTPEILAGLEKHSDHWLSRVLDRKIRSRAILDDFTAPSS